MKQLLTNTLIISSLLIISSRDAENFGRTQAPLVHGTTKTVHIDEDTFVKLSKVIEMRIVFMVLIHVGYESASKLNNDLARK